MHTAGDVNTRYVPSRTEGHGRFVNVLCYLAAWSAVMLMMRYLAELSAMILM
jgi:hypothetical protein